jgi:hypothetical protein
VRDVSILLGRSGLRSLREFNTCHAPGGSPAGGQFCSKSGGSTTAAGGARPKVHRTSNIDEAVDLILKGKTVELSETRHVYTVLHRLAGIAREAKRLGKDAPNYDLCQVSVPGTNLFCADKLRTKMPQLGGKAVPGSQADKLPRDKDGEVNAADAFVAHLLKKGIRTHSEQVSAASLKASQSELVGSKVAGMMANSDYNPASKSIFVSRDHYVVDGHHRWAATVGRDSEDGNLGGHKMKIIRIDAPISEILHLANAWTRKFGIAAKAAGKKRG